MRLDNKILSFPTKQPIQYLFDKCNLFVVNNIIICKYCGTMRHTYNPIHLQTKLSFNSLLIDYS